MLRAPVSSFTVQVSTTLSLTSRALYLKPFLALELCLQFIVLKINRFCVKYEKQSRLAAAFSWVRELWAETIVLDRMSFLEFPQHRLRGNGLPYRSDDKQYHEDQKHSEGHVCRPTVLGIQSEDSEKDEKCSADLGCGEVLHDPTAATEQLKENVCLPRKQLVGFLVREVRPNAHVFLLEASARADTLTTYHNGN